MSTATVLDMKTGKCSHCATIVSMFTRPSLFIMYTDMLLQTLNFAGETEPKIESKCLQSNVSKIRSIFVTWLENVFIMSGTISVDLIN